MTVLHRDEEEEEDDEKEEVKDEWDANTHLRKILGRLEINYCNKNSLGCSMSFLRETIYRERSFNVHVSSNKKRDEI